MRGGRPSVRGTLPHGLNETLFRNGPNPQFPLASQDWFADDGMVHAFALFGMSQRVQRRGPGD